MNDQLALFSTGDTILLPERRQTSATVRSARRHLSRRAGVLPARRQHYSRLQGEGRLYNGKEDASTESTFASCTLRL